MRLLPYLEQQTIYNAANMLLTSGNFENNTLSATGIATLWCPSDYGVTTAQGMYYPTASGQMVQVGVYWGNSYSAVTGPWEWDGFNLVPGTLDQLVPGEAQRIAQLGLIYPLSSVRLWGHRWHEQHAPLQRNRLYGLVHLLDRGRRLRHAREHL